MEQHPHPRQLDALTSLRFIAAAMIVVHHTRGYFGVPAALGDPFPLQHGVSFFFVLSGFILMYVYSTLAWSRVPVFWWARFARVWPAHALTLVLAPILLTQTELIAGDRVNTGAANLALVHGWVPRRDYFFSFNAVSWSVSTELGFYLLFPLLMSGFARNWPWKLALSCALLGCMIVAANLLSVLPGLQDSAGVVRGLVYINPLARLVEFVLGMTTFLLWQRLRSDPRLSVALCTAGEIGALILAIALMYVSGAWVTTWNAVFGTAGMIWFQDGGGAALGFAAVILVMALGNGLGARGLSHPLFVRLGEISYAVYLLHYMLLMAYARNPWIERLPIWISVPAIYAGILAAAYVVWRFFERPARRCLVSLAPAVIRPARATPDA